MFTLKTLLCTLTAYLASSGPVGIRLCHVLCDRDCSCTTPSYDSRHLSCSIHLNHRAPVSWDTKMCTSNTCLAVSTRRGKVRCVEKTTRQSHSKKDLRKEVWAQSNIEPLRLTRKQTKVAKEPLKPTEKETQVTEHLLKLTTKPKIITREFLKILEKKIQVTKDHFTIKNKPEQDSKTSLKRTKKTMQVTKASLKLTEFSIQSTRTPLQSTHVNNEPPKLTNTPTQVTNMSPKLTRIPPQVTNEPLKLTRMPTQVNNEPPKLTWTPTQVTNKPNKPLKKPRKHFRKHMPDLLWFFTKLYLSREWNSIYYWANIPKEGTVKIKMLYFDFLQLRCTRRLSCDVYLTVQVNRKKRKVYIQCKDCLRKKKKRMSLTVDWWKILFVQFRWAKNVIYVRVLEGEHHKLFPDLRLGTPTSLTDVLISDKSGRDYVEVAKTVRAKNTNDLFL